MSFINLLQATNNQNCWNMNTLFNNNNNNNCGNNATLSGDTESIALNLGGNSFHHPLNWMSQVDTPVKQEEDSLFFNNAIMMNRNHINALQNNALLQSFQQSMDMSSPDRKVLLTPTNSFEEFVEKGGQPIDERVLLYGLRHVKQETTAVSVITTADEKDHGSTSPNTTHENRIAYWTFRTYKMYDIPTFQVQMPQFKYCKKKRSHFTQEFSTIMYKSPYKYNMRLLTSCVCGSKVPQSCCHKFKQWLQDVKVTLDLVLEDDLQQISMTSGDVSPKKTNSPVPISYSEAYFNTEETLGGNQYEAVFSAFQMNVCSYNMGGKKFRLVVKLSKGDDLLMSLISPSFIIKAKKPIWKPGSKKTKSDSKVSKKRGSSELIQTSEDEDEDNEEEKVPLAKKMREAILAKKELLQKVVIPPKAKPQHQQQQQQKLEKIRSSLTDLFVPSTPEPIPNQVNSPFAMNPMQMQMLNSLLPNFSQLPMVTLFNPVLMPQSLYINNNNNNININSNNNNNSKNISSSEKIKTENNNFSIDNIDNLDCDISNIFSDIQDSPFFNNEFFS